MGRFKSVVSRLASSMDAIDAFPEHLSTTVVPVTLPEKTETLEYAARQGLVKAFILYQEMATKRVFVMFCNDSWHCRRSYMDNFKRAVLAARIQNPFEPDEMTWDKVSQGLMRNPDRPLKNTDKRMGFMHQNMFIVKTGFTFGFRTVKPGEIHLIQTTHVPMLMYELPSSSLKHQSKLNLYRRSFEPFDQMLYHRKVLEPHTAYPIPAGTHYILLTVQKTVFGVDIIPETILPQLVQSGFNLGDFRKVNRYDQKAYKLPPPTPAHGETSKRPLEEEVYPPSKKHFRIPKKSHKILITPVVRPPVMIARPALAAPQPVSIPPQKIQLPEPPVQIQLPEPPVQIQLPEPPVQIRLPQQTRKPEPPVQIQFPDPPLSQSPVQIQFPDPPLSQSPQQIQFPDPPVQFPPQQIQFPDPPVETSFDHLMSNVFGDCLGPEQVMEAPPAHAQEPQLIHTVPSLFDPNNDIISFLDHFEEGLAMEQPEAPLDLTMPRMNPMKRYTVGFKVTEPLNLCCK